MASVSVTIGGISELNTFILQITVNIVGREAVRLATCLHEAIVAATIAC